MVFIRKKIQTGGLKRHLRNMEEGHIAAFVIKLKAEVF